MEFNAQETKLVSFNGIHSYHSVSAVSILRTDYIEGLGNLIFIVMLLCVHVLRHQER